MPDNKTPVAPRDPSDTLDKIIRLNFAGKEYQIPVLRRQDAAKWRKYYFDKTQGISKSLPANFSGSPEQVSKAISQGMMQSLLGFPELLPDLIFKYAGKSLSAKQRKEIDSAAYDQEIIAAFKQIWGVAFAIFLNSLGMTMELNRAMESSSTSSASVN